MISSKKVQLRPVSRNRWRGWETLSCCGWLKQGGRGWFQVVRFQDGFSVFGCIWGNIASIHSNTDIHIYIYIYLFIYLFVYLFIYKDCIDVQDRTGRTMCIYTYILYIYICICVCVIISFIDSNMSCIMIPPKHD